MRRILILKLLLWASGAGFLHASGALAADLVLSADAWCPYNCDPRSDHPGFAVEIAREIFAGLGRGVEYRVVSWSRSIAEARAGRMDGLISATPFEVPDFLFPIEPVGRSSTGLAVRRDSKFRFYGKGSFEGWLVGAIANYRYTGIPGDYIEAHAGDRNRVQLVSGDDGLAMNLRKLAAGRLDIVVDDANVLAMAIDRQGLGAQVRIAAVTDCKPVYIAFSRAIPDGQALAQAFDDGFAHLRASGRLAAILARYSIHDCK